MRLICLKKRNDNKKPKARIVSASSNDRSFMTTTKNTGLSQRETLEAIGVTPRTIQKRIKALGLMEREERRHTKYGSVTNLYSFEGIIKAVALFAEEKLAKKVEAQAAEKARIKSKKPKLVVDNQP